MAKPTRVDYQKTTYDASGTSKDVTLSWNAGDIIVWVGQIENFIGSSDPTLTPTATGLTFTEAQIVAVPDYGYVRIMHATAGSSGSSVTCTTTRTGSGSTAYLWGAGWAVWRDSDGIGASSSTNVSSGAPSLDITTTQDNSAVQVANNDWNAADGASRTWRTVNGITPTSGNGLESNYYFNGAAYTTYAAYYDDVGTAGTKTVGLSAPTGQKYSIGAIEIKGSSASGFTLTCDSGTYTLSGQSVEFSENLSSAANIGGLVVGSGTAFVGQGFIGANEAPPAGSPYTIACAAGSYALNGQAVTLTYTPAASYSLTCAQGSYALSGQAASLLMQRVLVAAQGTYTLTGQDALVDLAMSCAQGTYTLSGQAATLTYTPAGAFTLTANQGSYTLTGQAAGLLAARLLTAAAGSYALSGQDVTLTYTPVGGFTLTADFGTYSLTGQAANLLRSAVLTAASGTHTLSGQNVTLTYTQAGQFTLTSDSGIYALTGQDASLLTQRRMTADQGTYTVTGYAATLQRVVTMIAAAGSYVLTGVDAVLRVARRLVADAGSYVLTGQPVTIDYAGAVQLLGGGARRRIRVSGGREAIPVSGGRDDIVVSAGRGNQEVG